MELIDRYLQAVRFWLPPQQQDDIIAELSEDLRAQIEERESELGRTLMGPDIEALLRKRGSPILVANGYLPQRWLIGPALFPIYLLVLKIVSLCVVGFIGFGWAVQVISHVFASAANPISGLFFGATFGTLCVAWFGAATMVTLVFAILERTQAKTDIFEKWNPRKLPPLRPPRVIPRSTSAIEIAVNLCVIVWWGMTMRSPFTLHIGSLLVSLSHQWVWFFRGVLLLTAGNASLALANLLRPWWTPARSACRIALDIGGSVFCCWLLKSDILASAIWPGASPARTAAVVNGVNYWLAQAFPAVVAISVAIFAANTWRLVRLMRKPQQQPRHPVTT
jgi:hypothetical protein